jgi:small subunit ribosomal protein S4
MLNDCKKCRREGVKLSLKGEKCLSVKCPVTKRPYAPGDHGQNFRSKLSEYGKQLREKQKARRIYGIGEVQFRSYVKLANKMLGNKTENLMRLLELRLDNVVYRQGYASSRSQARQMVSHGLFTVGNRKVTIPSYRLKVGEIVAPKQSDKFKDLSLNTSLTWIETDTKKLSGLVKHLPAREEIDTPVNESLIIEFYSR